MPVPPLPAPHSPGPRPSDDALFGKTLVAEGVLTAEQLQAAAQAQQTMRGQGVTLRLGEVLVRQKMLTPDQVRQFLQLAGKQLLHCPACGKNYNVKNWKPDREVFCPTCSTALTPPPSDLTLDAHSTQHLPATGAAEDARDRAGRPFGRYRLLEELGHGGMGVVWKAWDTKLKRIVAIKGILPGGGIDETQIERFMREAQLAAQLTHPNIIAVHDVGIHEGQHYFTTEYVAGRGLDAVMKKPVPVRQALAWTKTVAEALAYAHERGVVHRDVKPANVLIDGKGQAHVMDFGLAKSVEVGSESGGPRPALTVSGALMGTPQYMSPEQASGHADALGPATDQFSLGVMLYELITRQVPFRGNSLRELLNAITDREPVRPTRLAPRVHRDVETICLKALEKDPPRRYPSMADLAADVGRYLDGEPITARPLSPAARTWRKAVKHRWIVIPCAAALAIAAGFSAWGVWTSAQTSLAVATAEGKAGDAEARKRTQSEAMDLLELGRRGIDAASRYLYDADADYQELVRRVQRGQTSIEAAIAKAPDLAVAHYLLGRCWDLTGWEERAEACFRKALELNPQFAPAHYELGRLLMQRSHALTFASTPEERESNRPEARRLAAEAEKAFEASERGSGFDDPLPRAVAAALRAWVAGNGEAARRLAQEGLARFGADPGVEDFHWLAGLTAGDGTEAQLQAYDRAIRLRPKQAWFLVDRSLAHYARGGLDAAVADCSEALKISPRFAIAFFCRGNVRADQGDFRGAESDYTQALALHPGWAALLANRGSVRRGAGDFAGAIRDCDEALRIDPGRAEVLVIRGNVHQGMNEAAAALSDYGEAIRLRPRFAGAFYNRGIVREFAGDLDAAIADYDQALACNAEYTDALVNRARVHDLRAERLAAGGRKEEAAAERDRAGRDLEDALEIAPRNARAHVVRGNRRRTLGDPEGALQDFDEAVRIDPRYETARIERGNARRDRGDLAGAIQDYDAVLQHHPLSFEALHNRGNARQDQGDLAGAIRDYDEALEVKPRQVQTINNRGAARWTQGDRAGAIRDFEEAAAADPTAAEPHYNLGNALKAGSDLEGAIREYGEALKRNPGHRSALNARGAARLERGDLDGALQDFSESLKQDPSDARIWWNRGRVRHAQADWDAALADFNTALRLRPHDASVLNSRAVARRHKGDLDGAVQDATEALTLEPRYVEAWNTRGVVRAIQGKNEEAIRDFTEALRIDPRCGMAYVNRGIARKNTGDFEGAIRDYEEALKIDPQDAAALTNRGATRQDQKDFDAAIRDYDAALKINPRLIEAVHNRGLARKGRGDLDGAIDDYTAALKLNPRWKGALTDRAWARREKGDLDGAIQDYTAAIAIDPKDALSYYNRACAQAVRAGARVSAPATSPPLRPDEAEGLKARAFQDLEQALNAGYKNWDQMMRDSDLEALRSDGRWAALMKRRPAKK